MSLTDWLSLSRAECRLLEVILSAEPPADRLAIRTNGGKVHVVTRHDGRRYFWLIYPTEDGSMMSLEKVDPPENNSAVTVDTDDTVR